MTAAILVVFLFNALEPVGLRSTRRPPADAMLVEVTGQQFAWNVRYPGPDGVLGRTDGAKSPRRRTRSASTRTTPRPRTTCCS